MGDRPRRRNHNGRLVPTHEAAASGFKVQITGGGHGIAHLAVRAARKEPKGAGISDLLGRPQIYDMEQRYQPQAQPAQGAGPASAWYLAPLASCSPARFNQCYAEGAGEQGLGP